MKKRYRIDWIRDIGNGEITGYCFWDFTTREFIAYYSYTLNCLILVP